MKKILIIDDDLDLIENTKQFLEANSYEVISASSGKEGLAKAETENPDLFIIDVMMETWGAGFNVVDKLNENEKNKDVPRILLTALGLQSPLEPVTPEQMHVRFVLQKPLEPATLLKYVKSALDE
jgi:CheY-like chemotaxis protein